MEKKTDNVINISEYKKQRKNTNESGKSFPALKPVHLGVGLFILAVIIVFLYQTLFGVR